jgi:hypothetical protein
VKFGVIVDVEASRSIRQAEVGAARTMIERTQERFGLKPERLIGDTAYGAAPMLNWLVEEKGIAPHIPVFDKVEAGIKSVGAAGPIPLPQVKWPNHITGHCRLLQHNRPESDELDTHL